MAERAASCYLLLACGHFCPFEAEVLYRVFGPGDFSVMCERCGDFKMPRPVEPKEKCPDEPLF